MQNCENDKSDHQMRNKYFQFQRNEQSEIVSELHQCFWGGLSENQNHTLIYTYTGGLTRIFKKIGDLEDIF